MEPLFALLITFGLMWALLIRPQQRRMRKHQEVVASLQPGDEIITAGGIYGRVLSVDDRSMVVEVSPGVELRVLRAAVSERVTGAGDGNDGGDGGRADEADDIPG
ncbi:MAG: preprotein translocase subunit YajC [Actinomycetota bacterium]|jgi:preprotein translocase subunit YajC